MTDCPPSFIPTVMESKGESRLTDLLMSHWACEGLGISVIKPSVAVAWKSRSNSAETCAVIDMSEFSRDRGGSERDKTTIATHFHTVDKVFDFQLHPFQPGLIGMSSQGYSFRMFKFPLQPSASQAITEPIVAIKGHKKKGGLLRFNPAAENICATTDSDPSLRTWNIETGKVVAERTLDFPRFWIEWDYNGKMLASVGNDKNCHIWDGRVEKDAIEFQCHEGHNARVVFLDGPGGADNYVLTTGFGIDASREMKVWDVRDLKEPVWRSRFPREPGCLHPHWASAHKLVYIFTKGEATFQWYAFNEGSLHSLGSHRWPSTHKTIGFLPGRDVNPLICEIDKMYRVEKDNIVTPISLRLIRKQVAQGFQEDIYELPVPAGRSSMGASHWQEGRVTPIEEVLMKDLIPESRSPDEPSHLEPQHRDAEEPPSKEPSKIHSTVAATPQKGGGCCGKKKK
eukprot:GHVU01100119.1.p1 GENE.GHVU01100119.1~~GHVU01100119.1.p1  ORF type:complete len:455 (-),score=59.43 GHVU01100119.1:1572-2936(-)